MSEIDKLSYRLVDMSIYVAIQDKNFDCFSPLLNHIDDLAGHPFTGYRLWSLAVRSFGDYFFPIEWKKCILDFSLRCEEARTTFVLVEDMLERGDEEMLEFALNDQNCLKKLLSYDYGFQSLAIRAARLGRKEDTAYFSLSKVPFVGGPAQLIYSAAKTKNIPFLEKILELYKPVSHRDAQLWDMDFNDVVQFLQSENRKDLLEYFSQAGK